MTSQITKVTTHISHNEALIFERSQSGRIGYRLPPLDVDEIPLDQLLGPGVVVDVTRQCSENRDYLITAGDFRNWEKRNGKIPAGTIVLLRPGFGKFYPDRKRYLGTDERGAAAVANLHFPGLHPDAAR